MSAIPFIKKIGGNNVITFHLKRRKKHTGGQTLFRGFRRVSFTNREVQYDDDVVNLVWPR